MKKSWLLLLFLAACATVPIIPEQAVEFPVIQKPAQLDRAILYKNINDYVINKAITPYALVSTDAIFDNFAIIPVERYDVRYQSKHITVLVHVFKFSTRTELDVVLNSEFYNIIDRGTYYHRGHAIALYLSQDDHRIAIWSSGNKLVYVDTFIPDFAAQEIIEAYLNKYPSDLKTAQCLDSDGDNRFSKGATTRVRVDSTTIQWTDVCLRDFELYHNKQYISRKQISEEDGLLEGRCEQDPRRAGYVYEYVCPRGCLDGACKLK